MWAKTKLQNEVHPPLFQNWLIWHDFRINMVTIQPGLQLKGLKKSCPFGNLTEAALVQWWGHQPNLLSEFAAASPLETFNFESQGASLEEFWCSQNGEGRLLVLLFGIKCQSVSSKWIFSHNDPQT